MPKPRRIKGYGKVKMTEVMRQHCTICEQETEWDSSKEFSDVDWCKVCGCSMEMFEPVNLPGGCEIHPGGTHEHGFGMAGGGFGVYSICNECGSIFDKIIIPDEMDE